MSDKSSDFIRAVNIIFRLEGYDELHTDPGGLTKWGISKRANPDLDIASLTREQAQEVYYERYWLAVDAYKFSWPLNLHLFDAAVNQGVVAAKKMLQQSVGGLAVDGIIGRKTTARINSMDQDEVSALFLAQRALRYFGTRHFDTYGRGWLARLFRLQA